jgi:hypothetical protein
MIIYALMGMFIFSAFAPGSAVTSGTWDLHFILPWSGTKEVVWNLASGGYIVGFILAAALVGFLCERKWDRKPWVHFGFFLGNAVLYIPGILWLAHDLDVSLSTALDYGLYPFVVGDMAKIGLASLTLPVGWAIVQRFRKDGKDSGSGSGSTPA